MTYDDIIIWVDKHYNAKDYSSYIEFEQAIKDRFSKDGVDFPDGAAAWLQEAFSDQFTQRESMPIEKPSTLEEYLSPIGTGQETTLEEYLSPIGTGQETTLEEYLSPIGTGQETTFEDMISPVQPPDQPPTQPPVQPPDSFFGGISTAFKNFGRALGRAFKRLRL